MLWYPTARSNCHGRSRRQRDSTHTFWWGLFTYLHQSSQPHELWRREALMCGGEKTSIREMNKHAGRFLREVLGSAGAQAPCWKYWECWECRAHPGALPAVALGSVTD